MMRILLFCLLILSACSVKEKETDTPATAAPAVNEYPEIELTLLNGEKIQASTLTGKNIFVLFQPDCDHCQHEAEDIQKNIDKFSKYQLYFISSAPVEQIKKFAEDYKLNNSPKVTFAYAAPEGVINHYGAIEVPSIYIYANGEMTQSFSGQTASEVLVQYLD